MNLRSWAGPTALGVALASVAGGAVYLSRGSAPGVHAGSSSPPPKLRLASMRNAPMAMGAPASSGSSGYQLEGTLSSDKPADGHLRHPRAGTAAAADELAAALGLDGTPTEIKGGWALRGPANTVLILRTSGNWTWQMDCFAEQPLSAEDVNSGCAMDVLYVTAPPPGPSDTDAIATARPVLDSLGFAGLDVSAGPGGDSQTAATVTPAAGWATSVLVSASKKVVGGTGWLSGSTEGDAYPLISAADAFEALKAQPRPMLDMCMQRKDGQPGCEEPPPTVITGGTLGLMLDFEPSAGTDERGNALLVPAWLFTVKGGAETIPIVAVDPAYLEQPSPEPVPSGKPEPGASSDPGCPPDSCVGGGTSGSSGGGAVPPAPQASPNSSGDTTEAWPIDAYTLEGDSVIHVRVEYGGCESNPRLDAKQGPDAVYLIATMTSDHPQGTTSSCTMELHVADLTVTLDAALGDRKVYDAHDGRELQRRK